MAEPGEGIVTALEEYETEAARWSGDVRIRKADAAIESLKFCVCCDHCGIDEDGCGSCSQLPERDAAGYLANDVGLFDYCHFTPSRWQERTP